MSTARAERVAIVGSRPPLATVMSKAAWHALLDRVEACVEALPIDTVVVTGMARGVDVCAANAADERGMLVVEVPVKRGLWNRVGKRAGFARNAVIAELCTRMVAFWDGESRGTAHAIECARKLGKPVEVIR